MAKTEEIAGRNLAIRRPFLVSVRSGAGASMPGMMDTILNLSLNDVAVEAMAKKVRQSALGVRQLQKIYPDVLGCRYVYR